MEAKGKVVRFPLGSSTDVNDADMTTLEETVRQGMTDLIVIGLDAEGELTIIHDPAMPPERAYFLTTKALKRMAEEPLDMVIEDEDDEEPLEEDDEREDQS